ncbi:MAG TPA: hypothetical protein VL974_14180 [Magnetospirillum sp.]|jgi:hypothetical protein|nr:hypothetical protein [Magnetospirillum sp.]
MPYVIRDENGNVVGVSAVPLDDAAEAVAPDSPEFLQFLTRACGAEEAGDDGTFTALDLAFIRVLEDLVEVLLRRGVVALSDLPAAAQDKLMQRRALRGWLAGVVGVVDDDDGKVI